MKKYLIGIALVFLIILGIHFFNVISYNQIKNNIRILTEEYPPLQYMQDGELKGVAVEVVQDILDEIGLKKDIELLDWETAYQMTINEPNMVLFSMMKNNEREDLFKWVGPIGTLKINFYALKESEINLHNLEDISSFKVGAVKDYGYTQDLKEKGYENLIEYDSERQALEGLLNKEVDLYLTSNIVMDAFMEQGLTSISEIEKELNFSIEQFYLAFSKDYSDKVLKEWEEALTKIKQESNLVFIKNDL